MILVSYINARGEEIILDDTEHSFDMGELYGREGTQAPSLKYTEILYGDGSTDIVVVNPMPREVTLYFWSRMTDATLRRALEEIKLKMYQVGVKNGNWGQLKIYVPDLGAYRYLNCVYTGGFDNYTRQYPSNVKFALTFRASDPYFYNGYETETIIEPEATEGYLYLADDLYMEDLTDPSHDDSSHNPYSLYFHTAEVETTKVVTLTSQKIYPRITFSGSGKNIRLINQTTGKKIELNTSVTIDGDHPVIIETKPMQRKCVQFNVGTGEEVNILNKLTADSSLDFYLDRGDNIILYRNSEATPESLCTFSYTEGFLSAE